MGQGHSAALAWQRACQPLPSAGVTSESSPNRGSGVGGSDGPLALKAQEILSWAMAAVSATRCSQHPRVRQDVLAWCTFVRKAALWLSACHRLDFGSSRSEVNGRGVTFWPQLGQ